MAKVMAEDRKIGPGLLLKVMAGDKVNLYVDTWYEYHSSYAQNDLTLLVPDLLQALSGSIAALPGTAEGAGSVLGGSGSSLGTGLSAFITDQDGAAQTDRPKAFLNWVLFDEQFNYVSSGGRQVKTPDRYKDDNSEPITLPLELQNVAMTKNGYLFAFVSNGSSTVPVYFDNLSVTHIRGPLLEETHYYPFGLTMAGISSKAAGGAENKKNKFQDQEYNDAFDVDYYDFKYRNHDPQIGRFIQIDPLANRYVYNSTYAFSENKVIAHVELEGLESVPIASLRAAQYSKLSQGGVSFAKNTGGMISNPRIQENRVTQLERKEFTSSISGVVLHRTESSSTEGTLNAFREGRNGVNYGTHFLVGKDGEILQTASLNDHTLHVGKVRDESYPTNQNSIGIEVVGKYNYEDKSWEPLTSEQIQSVSFLVNSLLKTYGLQTDRVYSHDQISYKTEGEGKIVYDAIKSQLNPALAPKQQ